MQREDELIRQEEKYIRLPCLAVSKFVLLEKEKKGDVEIESLVRRKIMEVEKTVMKELLSKL